MKTSSNTWKYMKIYKICDSISIILFITNMIVYIIIWQIYIKICDIYPYKY